MPVTADGGFVIRHAIYVIPAANARAIAHPHRLFDDSVRPDPRLMVRPGSDRADLVAVKHDASLRCAGGPRASIDLDATRQRGADRARQRYAHWRRNPRTIRLRNWEKTLVEQDLNVYIEYWSLRIAAADALIHPDGTRLCPVDTTLAAGLRYAREANHLLDDLPDDTLMIAATL